VKLVLVAHGYPPELEGGTERAVQGQARALARRGHEVVVVAGSLDHAGGFRTSRAEDADPESGARIPVLRIHRADLYFDHWQKSHSARASQAWREILRELRPDVVHVHHWIRLSRDLVAIAARERIPAVLTLHDLWTSCLVAFRVQPQSRDFCEAKLGPHPCIACAGATPPRTPWMTGEALHLSFAQRRADLLRELELARVRIAPSRAHAETLEGFLGLEPGRLALEIVPPGRELALTTLAPIAPPERLGRLTLGLWSHLHPLKGQDLVLDAIARTRDPRRIELHLAGGEADAEYASELRLRARDLVVRFHGAYRADDLGQHPVTRVHAMPSGTRARESWGLVVDEALALGLPMVLPRSGAFPERLSEGAGVLFYGARDAGDLAACLDRLIDERGRLARLRAALPRVEQALPGPAQVAARLEGLYEAALARGAPEVGDEDWFRASLAQRCEEEWDRSLARRSAAELGLA
jgi:glycosyltransferase involved in cell wall biosynthesis